MKKILLAAALRGAGVRQVVADTGRAVIGAELDRPGARIVFFGAK